MIQPGTHAPDFTLPDQLGQPQSLSSYAGKWCVVYFYPKDDTPGCVTEACSIRDLWQDYQAQNIEVFGISADSVDSHLQFQKKYNLPFHLLADTDKQVIMRYEAWGEKLLFGKRVKGIHRHTYIINPEGRIEKVFDKVVSTKHGQHILAAIETLRKA